MSFYLFPLKVSTLFFFVLIQFIAIPILLIQYKKQGALTFTKGLVIYSFIFYMITAFFMTLLPLPTHEFVDSLTSPFIQPIPFMFIKDIIQESSFRLLDTSTYIKALTNPALLQVVFNILLTLPFGVYLRYYFKKDLKTVIVYTFLLSLFYEVTQITGVYGLYSRPYRLFDVDDLMLNTLGGVVGYYSTPFVMQFFISKETLDNRVKKASKDIPVLRRALAFYIDYFILRWVFGFIFNKNSLINALVSAVVLSLINLYAKKQSLGLRMMNLKIVKEDQKELDLKTLMKRNISFYLLFNMVFILSIRLFDVLNTQYYDHTWMLLIYIIVMFTAQFIFITHLTYHGMIKKEQIFHERFSKTVLMNTLIQKEGLNE